VSCRLHWSGVMYTKRGGERVRSPPGRCRLMCATGRVVADVVYSAERVVLDAYAAGARPASKCRDTDGRQRLPRVQLCCRSKRSTRWLAETVRRVVVVVTSSIRWSMAMRSARSGASAAVVAASPLLLRQRGDEQRVGRLIKTFAEGYLADDECAVVVRGTAGPWAATGVAPLGADSPHGQQPRRHRPPTRPASEHSPVGHENHAHPQLQGRTTASPALPPFYSLRSVRRKMTE